MQMDHLRCKEPHRVHNELLARLLAYNLIRQLTCGAATDGDLEAWQISFKSTLSRVVELLATLSGASNMDLLYAVLLQSCQRHRAGNRPDRYEQSVLKRRAKGYKLLQMQGAITNPVSPQT
jgi:hypothetical protein